MGIIKKLIRALLGPPTGRVCKSCRHRAVSGIACEKCGFLCKSCVIRIAERKKRNNTKFCCPKCGGTQAWRLK
ncbi:MAG: hypothetical protein NT118_09020 [Lentisphaerae bacterium]|nr:hypothetical protein [Lentisphaerota bacterium]